MLENVFQMWRNNLNWYKQSSIARYRNYKIAFPIQETKSPRYYSDEAHYGHEIYMWCMDKDYNLYTELVESDWDAHEVWNKFKELLRQERLLAWGRYSEDDQTASLAAGYSVYGQQNPRRTEYILNKIETILDKEFENPRIIEFLPNPS